MRIRYKILLILGIVILSLMAALYGVAETLMFNGISASETKHATEDANRFINNLNSVIDGLSNTVNDWANWDDTYFFVEDNNEQYESSNLVDDTFDNLQLNLMLFFNQNGQLVTGRMFDLSSGSPVPLDTAVIEQVKSYTGLFSSNMDYEQSGIISVNETPMMVAAHPILTSLQQGPSHGTMIIGRFLDASELALLSKSTGLPVTGVSVDNIVFSEDFELAMHNLSNTHPIFVNPLNSTTMSAYVLLSDVNGQPLLTARVDSDRTEYTQGATAMRYIGVFLIATIAAMFLCLAFLLNKMVISKISALNNTVLKVKRDGDNSVRVKVQGNDELASLGENINSMLNVIENNTASLETTVKERTRDLLENQKKLASILAASPDAIVALDSNGNITECNSRITELSGYQRSDLIGKSGLQFTGFRSEPNFLEKTRLALHKNKEPLRFETLFSKKTGLEIPVELSVDSIRNEFDKPAGAVVIIRDLSEKKRMEQQLLKVQRLAAIGELAGMVGHDIRNPLAAIKNADFFIKKKCGGCGNSEVVPMIDVIDKSIEHANSIVDDLLEYSREQCLAVMKYSARDLLDKALGMTKIQDNINLVNSVSDVTLTVDKSKAIRVFINLTKNALDAMPEGGSLEISANQNTEFTEISFSDTGKGISEEVMPKLFTPLFTTKAQGMGFGLSISKRIVEAHGGKISVHSTPEKGTTFTVAFPNNPSITPV
jgi:PAS domain S-box-containing protein